MSGSKALNFDAYGLFRAYGLRPFAPGIILYQKVQNNAINIKIVHDSEFKTLKLSYIMIP